LGKLLWGESGQDAVEYALLAAFFGLGAALMWTRTGNLVSVAVVRR
jgi:Flp pilus assembly pilin Flp